jgi:cytochrome P450
MDDMSASLPADRFVDVDLASEELRQNFRTVLAEWAQRPPFYVMQNGLPQAVCARFSDMKEVMNDRARFSSVPPEEKSAMRRFMPNKFMRVTPPTQMEGPQHARLRRLINPAFSDAAIAEFRPKAKTIISGLLDEVEAGGPSFDAMHDFASKLMPRVMLEGMFGFTPEQRDIFVTMNKSLRLTSKLSPADPFPQAYTDAFENAERTINAIIAERRNAPGDDIVSKLVLAGDGDNPLSDTEIFELIFVFGAGAIESTASSMGAALLTLCQHPDQFDELKRDLGLVPAAIEECLRYHGPGFLLFTRYASVDTELSGTPMPAGIPIYVCHQAAAYDPVQYPDPLRFDIHRNPQAVPVFGGGVHFCVGHRLARTVLGLAMTELLERFPNARLADDDFAPLYDGAVSETQLVTLPMRLS